MNSLSEINEPLAAIDFWGNEIYYPDSDGQPMAETDFHRNLILELIKTLEIFFAESPDVYVTGNIMFYYVEHDPKQVVSPDVMVFFGVPKGERRSYKTWEENDVVPPVVIEISSLGTWSKDRIEKRLLYELLGVKEYYIFNPLTPRKVPVFMAFVLEDGVFVPVSVENNRVKSDVLGLELVVSNKTLRLFNPQSNEFLKNAEELAVENENLKFEIERLKTLLEKNS